MRGVTGVVPMIRAAMSGENRARRAASGNCSRHIELTHAAQTVVNGSIDAGTPVPENKPAFDGDKDLLHRAFDKGACDMVHTFRKMLHERALDVQDTAAIIAIAPYQAARGAFEQGEQVSEGSSICTDTHLQIAVRDLNCIKGWFLIPGQKLLSDDELQAAKQRQLDAIAQRRDSKPRRRATAKK